MKANALITVVITGLALHANAQVNNKKTRSVFKGYNKIIKINREWKSGDVVELKLPIHIFTPACYENSIAFETWTNYLCIKNC